MILVPSQKGSINRRTELIKAALYSDLPVHEYEAWIIFLNALSVLEIIK